MTLNCIAVDDEPLALRIVAEFANRHPNVQLLATFQNVEEAEAYMQQRSVDLIFLDIHMRETNGVSFAQQLSIRPLLIFTTAYKEYALDGFELDAVDYLLKPFDYLRFSRAVEKAIGRMEPNTQEKDFVTVYEEYRLVKIYFEDIEYIEGMQDYVKIHLTDGSMVMTLSTLKNMVDRLPSDRFIRIHRSYIVSRQRIRSFANRKIKLGNGLVLNVGDRYFALVQEWLKGH